MCARHASPATEKPQAKAKAATKTKAKTAAKKVKTAVKKAEPATKKAKTATTKAKAVAKKAKSVAEPRRNTAAAPPPASGSHIWGPDALAEATGKQAQSEESRGTRKAQKLNHQSAEAHQGHVSSRGRHNQAKRDGR